MLRPATRALAAVAALLGLAACATSGATTAAPAAKITRPEGLGYGVIVSMRPLAGGQTATAATDEVRAGILKAIGTVTVTDVMATSSAASGAPVEFIVREDDGGTISVVQANDAKFRPGDRVVLIGGPRTRLARVPG